MIPSQSVPPIVRLSVETKLGKTRVSRVKSFAKKALSVLGFSRVELSLVITDDRHIRAYNRKFLKHDRPTDVLAFGHKRARGWPQRPGFIGDVMISAERARSHALRFGTTYLEELELYIVHGLLHLAGFDDSSPVEKRRMRRKECLVLRRIHKAGIRL